MADSFGVVFNMDFCTGATPRVEGFPDVGSSGNIVIKLASIVPEKRNFKIYADNYFLNVPLYIEMFKRGIQNIGHC